MSEPADATTAAPRALPTIEYSTDHVDVDAMFQPENAVRLQLLADAIAFRRQHTPFGGAFFVTELGYFALLSVMFRSVLVLPILGMVVATEYLHSRLQGSRHFGSMLLAKRVVHVAVLMLLWIGHDPTTYRGMLLYSVIVIVVAIVISILIWFRKRRRWEELSLVRIQPGLDKVFDDVDRDLRSRNYEQAAHVYVGPFNLLLRIGRVGGLLVSVGGKKGLINFAYPENVSIAAEPRKPGSTHDRFWLLWNDERFRIRADTTAIGVFQRLKSDVISRRQGC